MAFDWTMYDMSLLRLLAALLASLFLVQGQEIAQCNASTGYDWSFNSLDQSPCEIASYLGSVCNDGVFTISSLSEGRIYTGPTVEAANACRCSSVFYSLLSACAGCQARNFQRWSRYNVNCSTVSVTFFPEDIPAGTSVPHWAYLDVAQSDTFNATAAFLDARSNSAETSGTPVSSESTTPSAPPTSQTPNPSNESSSSSGGSNAGAIAGGVIGGVALLGIVAGVIFWFLRRRRSRQALPPSATAPTMSTFASPSPVYPAQAPTKLYDPSDPSTFPTSVDHSVSPFQPSNSPMSSMYTTPPYDHPPLNTSTITSTRPLQPNRLYTGAPEI